MPKRVPRIEKQCEVCGTIMIVTIAKSSRRFCSRKCQFENYRVAFLGENNPAYGMTYRSKETHPEWAAKIQTTTKERGINIGDKNGMKDPEVRARMSKTRRERVTSNPSYRKARSIAMRQAWADGKYEGVAVGKCKWYDHIKPNGDVIRLQGTWELAYAKYLDEQEITYLAHKGAIWYTRSADNTKRVYLPDFHLLDTDVYLDIKNDYLLRIDQQKFKDIRTCNPTLKLKIITKSELILLNILQKD
jgi:hypothetical protein